MSKQRDGIMWNKNTWNETDTRPVLSLNTISAFLHRGSNEKTSYFKMCFLLFFSFSFSIAVNALNLFLLEQPSTVWVHDYVALMFRWWAPIGMCEDARGGQQPLYLREKQECLSFFLSFTLLQSNVHIKCESPTLLQLQVTPDLNCLKNNPKYTFSPAIYTTKSSMYDTYLNQSITWRLTSNLRMNCVDYGLFHAVSSGYQSISDGAGFARVNEVYRRHPAALYRHFGAIWSFFYTRILITNTLPMSRWDQEQRSLPPQRFLQLYLHPIQNWYSNPGEWQ